MPQFVMPSYDVKDDDDRSAIMSSQSLIVARQHRCYWISFKDGHC